MISKNAQPHHHHHHINHPENNEVDEDEFSDDARSCEGDDNEELW